MAGPYGLISVATALAAPIASSRTRRRMVRAVRAHAEGIVPPGVDNPELYQGARRHKVKRMVFASSNHAFGMYSVNEKLDHGAAFRPDGFYGLSKAWGEAMTRMYWDKHGIEGISIRIGTAFDKPPADFRQLSTWFGTEDLLQLMTQCIRVPDVGYMTVWVGFSAAATLAQWALHDAALLSASMAVASPRVAGALLVAAGAYQLTPAKRACLEHCQSPLGFLMSHWRDGPVGTYQMGLRHGIYCLGCCWALMAVLFAVGVMNLVFVAALALFVLLEKTGPAGLLVARAGGVLLLAAGAFMLATG